MTVYIGDTVKNLRKGKGLSQTQLAENIGCSLRSISAIERNESQPTATQLKELSGFFGVSIDYLIFGSEDVPNQTEREILRVVRSDRSIYDSLLNIVNSKKTLNGIAA